MSESSEPVDHPSGLSDTSYTASSDELQRVDRLRSGDDAAFTALVEQYYASMIRIAALYVSDTATAEDVVQETWLAVLQGLERFEGRSSLKTWIFTILTNRAKTRGQRETRQPAPFAALNLEMESLEPTVPPHRFQSGPEAAWPEHWIPDSRPVPWDELPEDHVLRQEVSRLVMAAIRGLPPSQQEVIRLRDVEGWSATDVCNILQISETNQRVLLHRARARVRSVLETYFDG